MKEARARVGLTGASGFLGRALTRALLAHGLEVELLGRDEARPWKAEWPPERMEAALSGLQFLIHAAARVPRDMRDASEAKACLWVNALGTLALTQAAQAAGIQRFLFVSTANFVERRQTPIEDDAFPGCHPLSAPYYLTSKLIAETYVLAAATGGMQVLIVRPSAIYGPGMTAGSVSVVLNRLRSGEPVVLRDGGRHSADYVFLDDVADLIAMAVPSTLVGHLNAGSGVGSDLHRVVEAARALFPHSASTVTVEPSDGAWPPPGFSALNVTRAQIAFDYRPRSLVQGMRDMLAQMVA